MLPRSIGHRRSARRIASLAAATLLVLPALVVAVGSTPARAATHTVEIGDGFFSPATLTVAVGDTVTWTNVDDSPHTVSAATFDSGNLDGGQTFSFTFTEAGTFDYVCSYHDEMIASITVTGPAAATASTPAPSNAAAPAAPAATQRAASDDEQPDTALIETASTRLAGWVAPLLIGVGLIAFAVGILPVRRSRVTVADARRDGGGGWRR
ncbi:MAG TPA: cupredoxin family copper-binding protein [Candidatus Limnocylindria bacterium]|nr:cupredoxin family copper-binding protein [Candidatus Limnocylindria bacterium]